MTEKELLIDCFQRFNRSGIEYMLTGSMASNYWGIPRTTHNLDFVVQMTANDVPLLTEHFQEDFFIQPKTALTALRPPYNFNALDERTALKVDFWVLHDDPFELQVFVRRRQVTLFDTPAWICSAEDVVLHKMLRNKMSGSESQIEDIAGVYAVQGDDLDNSYLSMWAEKLNVADVWRDVVEGKIRPKST